MDILAIAVCALAYALRGGLWEATGWSNWIGRLLWLDTILLVTHDPLTALGAFVGMSFISHGAYVKLSQIPVGSKETWLGPNTSFWRCFAALMLIGYMRGTLMWGLSWQAYALAVAYPVACAVTSRMRANLPQELITGSIYGALLISS